MFIEFHLSGGPPKIWVGPVLWKSSQILSGIKNTVVRTRAWNSPVQVQNVLALRRNGHTLFVAESKMFQRNVLYQQYRREVIKPWNTSRVKTDETLGLMRKQTNYLSPKAPLQELLKRKCNEIENGIPVWGRWISIKKSIKEIVIP